MGYIENSLLPGERVFFRTHLQQLHLGLWHHRAGSPQRLVRQQMLVVQQFHDELGGLEEIILLVLGNPKLRLDLRHALGQFQIGIRLPCIEQLPERDVAHFATALTRVIHRQPPLHLLVYLFDRNTHSH